MNRSGIAALVVALGAGAVLGGGIATAASKSPSIHACESKSSGALRIAKHCRASEKVVTWNTIGKQGAKGTKGAPGPRGPAGSSLAATLDFANVPMSDSLSSALIPIDALPNGDYTYAVSISFTNDDDATYDGTCEIDGQDLGTAFTDDQQSTQIPPSLFNGGNPFNVGGMTLVGTFSRSANTAFEPGCYTQDPGTHMTATFNVVFTRVSNIVNSAS